MKELQSLIFQSLGEASMCWEHPDKAGEFNTSQAIDIGDRLTKEIEQLIERATGMSIEEVLK